MNALAQVARLPDAAAVHSTRGLVVSRPEDARPFEAIPGEMISIRVHSSQVGGHFAILESLLQPRCGPPLHTHREDETFQVLEGTMTFLCEGRRLEGGPGTIVHVPAGMAHAWANLTDRPARMLVTLSPGGLEDIFAQLAGRSPAEFGELVERYGSVIVGGPISS
ncbi:cupin domain-containing protein [Enterovirga aerilata]|uniref:Cupin domain-containing protein n=1 Tax=Enterovirga aerilata TaxID=2730920 RepID=A0A849I6E9_9HYPH|nr:cupin domain-containing protein [Enterovirga sp. DB1703]NNM71617.1 cupin domain-containing protein [Enterovirga sp. DB1703]